MSENNSLVATYTDHDLAKATIEELQKTGLDMSKLSIVGKDENKTLGGVTVLDGLHGLGAKQYGCISRETIPDYEAELKAGRLLLFFMGRPMRFPAPRSSSTRPTPKAGMGT